MLEVNDANLFVQAEEEVLLLDVRMVDATTLLERGQLLQIRSGRPRSLWEELRRLWERNSPVTSHVKQPSAEIRTFLMYAASSSGLAKARGA